MSNENLKLWDIWKRPPSEALKKITGGRMNGKTDINPMWRIKVLTETFGACGNGWYYTIEKLWSEKGTEDQLMCFATINLFTKNGESWSSPVQGVGGNMLITKEKNGMHNSDEGYKMAVTDALSVACKMLGIGADVYMGAFDVSKYGNPPPQHTGNIQNVQNKPQSTLPKGDQSEQLRFTIGDILTKMGMTPQRLMSLLVDNGIIDSPKQPQELTIDELKKTIDYLYTLKAGSK